MSRHIVGDLSTLPAAGFRAHGLWFWAGIGFMVIEGTALALAGAAYVYLMNSSTQWPLADLAPDLLWGSAFTAVLLLSLIPNALVSHAARKRALGPTRLWTVAMAVIGVAALILRGFEFGHLNTRWDQDAYGSVVWALMLLHTVHLVTDLIDTAFLAVFQFTHQVDTERFSDTDDNAGYWAFVVATWAPFYLLIYWAPRWMP